MPGWKWLLVFFSTGYLALVALMYVAQRGLMYFPETFRTAPAEAGLPQAEEAMLDTPDGARVIVWHIPPQRRPSGLALFPRQRRRAALPRRPLPRTDRATARGSWR